MEPVQQIIPSASPPTFNTLNPSAVNLDVKNMPSYESVQQIIPGASPPTFQTLNPSPLNLDLRSMPSLESAHIIPAIPPPIISTLPPSNIPINIKDLKAVTELGRQDRIEAAKKKNPKPRPRSGWRDWASRILVGKEEAEELYEQRYHKKRSWFKKEVRRHVAEFIGTFFLVLFICGIQINQGLYPNGGVSNIDKGLTSAFVLTGLIFCFGRISGAHFNPCVTLAFFLRGAFKLCRCITYIIFQFAGAVSAAAVLYDIFGVVDYLGTTTPGDGLTNPDAFGVEILLTFLLISVILTTAENANILGATSGLAVGSTFGAIELLGWNFSGASVNPWRTIGPTIIADYAWDTYWIYISGPLVGTILAVLVQRLMVTGVPRHETLSNGQGAGKIDNFDY